MSGEEPESVTIPGWGVARLRDLVAAAGDETATDEQRLAAVWQLAGAVEYHVRERGEGDAE